MKMHTNPQGVSPLGSGFGASCLAKPQRNAVLTARFPQAGYGTFIVDNSPVEMSRHGVELNGVRRGS